MCRRQSLFASDRDRRSVSQSVADHCSHACCCWWFCCCSVHQHVKVFANTAHVSAMGGTPHNVMFKDSSPAFTVNEAKQRVSFNYSSAKERWAQKNYYLPPCCIRCMGWHTCSLMPCPMASCRQLVDMVLRAYVLFTRCCCCRSMGLFQARPATHAHLSTTMSPRAKKSTCKR